jgi:hypothetical protein
MGFVGAFVVDLVDCSRGLALLWRENREVEIQFFSHTCIKCYSHHASHPIGVKGGFPATPSI